MVGISALLSVWFINNLNFTQAEADHITDLHRCKGLISGVFIHRILFSGYFADMLLNWKWWVKEPVWSDFVLYLCVIWFQRPGFRALLSHKAHWWSHFQPKCLTVRLNLVTCRILGVRTCERQHHDCGDITSRENLEAMAIALGIAGSSMVNVPDNSFSLEIMSWCLQCQWGLFSKFPLLLLLGKQHEFRMGGALPYGGKDLADLLTRLLWG